MKIFFTNPELQNRILNRFIKLVKICSQSSCQEADSGKMPSTQNQQEFAKFVSTELKSIGLKNVQITENCYIYGILPATKGMERFPTFCLIAHLDTVDEVSGLNVKPIIHAGFDNAQIDLLDGISLDPKQDKYLAEAAKNHDTIITSDGTTLLGADDKAGITEIICALEYFKEHKEIKHGAIEVLFSPDEETGHGMDKVPLDLLQSKFAYTVDGGHLGELETECFNAFSAEITFSGNACHTGDARKNNLVNANNALSQFITNIPANERPESTDGYNGFYAVMTCLGTIEQAKATVLLRDFTESGMNDRLEKLQRFAISAADSVGAKVDIKYKQQYKNMKSVLDAYPSVVECLEQAYKAAGVEIIHKPIRGGTDGARLCEMGIPTPNIFTGGHNFHSKKEWASLQQMSAATDVLINLAAAIVSKNI